MPKLLIRRRNGEEEECLLSSQSLYVGKSAELNGIRNDLILNDETVSRRHARIYQSGEGYYIEDLDSKNHTFVNEIRVKKSRLRHGDRIKIGFNSIRFIRDDEKTTDSFEVTMAPHIVDPDRTVEFNYGVLQQVSAGLQTANNVDDFLTWVVAFACESLNAQCGVIEIPRDDQAPQIVISGETPIYASAIIERVCAEGEGLLISRHLELDQSLSNASQEIRSVMCVPLMSGKELLGALYLEDPLPAKFSERGLQLLNDIAAQAAFGIEKLMLDARVDHEIQARSGLEQFLATLQESVEANKALLNAYPDLMLRLAADGNILNLSAGAWPESFLPEDATGTSIFQYLPEAIADNMGNLISEALGAEQLQIFEFSLQQNGKTRYFENRIVACGEAEVLSIIRDISRRVLVEQEREQLIEDLKEALAKINTLCGLIPICSACKKIRDDKGYWNQLEVYIQKHSDAEFTHSMCPDCMHEWYPEHYRKKQTEDKKTVKKR